MKVERSPSGVVAVVVWNEGVVRANESRTLVMQAGDREGSFVLRGQCPEPRSIVEHAAGPRLG